MHVWASLKRKICGMAVTNPPVYTLWRFGFASSSTYIYICGFDGTWVFVCCYMMFMNNALF